MYYSSVRRPLWFRALTAFWGLWFAVALIEPAGIHQCPVHGLAAGQMVGMAAMPDMAPMAGMAGMATAHDASPAGHSHHGATCTCLSIGCSSPAFAAPGTAVVLAHYAVVRGAAPNFADAPHPIVARAHALPFANGPPGSV